MSKYVSSGPYSALLRENTDQKKTPYLDNFHAVLTTITFHVCFSSIHEFKFTSFSILAISNPGDSYKLLQRQKIQGRKNRNVARTKTNKNNGVKIKDKETNT